ncbi:MAG: hypothetical protein CSA26_11265 [Desulfobacterales bacterium]|nr:MAG: hypothetical protein CSA26_11265 [Desulfobacterales bacterium]
MKQFFFFLFFFWQSMHGCALSFADEKWSSELHGYLKTEYKQAWEEDIPLLLREQMWAEYLFTTGKYRFFFSGHLDTDLSAILRNTEEERADLVLHEAYVTDDLTNLDIIAGLQQIRWGTADSLSTVDIINPIDYRNPVATARSTNRLSVPAIDFNFSIKGDMLDIILVPWPRFSKLPAAGSPWEPEFLEKLRKMDEEGSLTLRDRNNEETPEWGLNYRLFRHRFDIGVLFYDGYEHFPLFSMSTTSTTKPPVVNMIHERYQTCSVDLAFALDDGTLRAESTLKINYPFQSDNLEIVQNDYMQWLFGWEQTFDINVRIDGQIFYYKRLTSDIISGVERETWGVTASIENKFLDDALTSGFRGVWYTTEDSFMIEQFNTYDYNDHWKISFGLLYLNGNSDGPVSGLEDNSNIYLEVKYNF